MADGVRADSHPRTLQFSYLVPGHHQGRRPGLSLGIQSFEQSVQSVLLGLGMQTRQPPRCLPPRRATVLVAVETEVLPPRRAP